MREVIPISIYKPTLFDREYSVLINPTSPAEQGMTPKLKALADAPSCASAIGDADAFPTLDFDTVIAPTPDPDTDISVIHSPTVSDLTAAFLAAQFLLCVRGLPLEELTVATGENKLTLFADRDRIRIPLRRLRPDASLRLSVFSVDLDAETYASECGSLCVLECERCDFFSDDAAALIFTDFSTRVAACVAFSRSNDRIEVKLCAPKCSLPPDPLSVAEAVYSAACRSRSDLSLPLSISLPTGEVLIERASGRAVISLPKSV